METKRCETVRDLIREFGGPKAVAEKFGIGRSAVQNWINDNKIPVLRALHLRALCEKREIDFDFELPDFGSGEAA